MNDRILLVINSAQRGGAGVMLSYVANLYAENSIPVVFMSIYRESRRDDLSKQVNYESLGILSKGKVLWRIKAICGIRKSVKRNRSNIVLCFMSDVSFLGRLATIGLDVKFISAERNDPYSRPLVWKFITMFTYAFSTKCVFQLDYAMSFFPVFIRKKSIVIPNPVREIPSYRNKNERKKTIVSAGRFVWEKGFDVLINAFVKVHDKQPEYNLIIYGDGPELNEYYRLVKENGLDNFVSFPGFVENLSSVIANDGLFVLPSRSEGIPNVLIEALALGIPTISTNCSPGGPFFLTEGGENGLLVPVDDIESLYQAIIRVIETPELAEKLSNKGPDVIKKLKPEIINKMWFELIQ